jgi:hypothetical protein
MRMVGFVSGVVVHSIPSEGIPSTSLSLRCLVGARNHLASMRVTFGAEAAHAQRHLSTLGAEHS